MISNENDDDILSSVIKENDDDGPQLVDHLDSLKD